MNANQQRVLLSFRRVIAFVEERPRFNATTTPELTAIATQIAALKDIVNRTGTKKQTRRVSCRRDRASSLRQRASICTKRGATRRRRASMRENRASPIQRMNVVAATMHFIEVGKALHHGRNSHRGAEKLHWFGKNLLYCLGVALQLEQIVRRCMSPMVRDG